MLTLCCKSFLCELCFLSVVYVHVYTVCTCVPQPCTCGIGSRMLGNLTEDKLFEEGWMHAYTEMDGWLGMLNLEFHALLPEATQVLKHGCLES